MNVKNVRIHHNIDGAYQIIHPETNVTQVIDVSGKPLSDILTEIKDSSNLKIENVEGLQASTLNEAISELMLKSGNIKADLLQLLQNNGVGGNLTSESTIEDIISVLEQDGLSKSADVLRLSHISPAPLTSPVSLQFSRAFQAGTAYDQIKLYEDGNPGTNLISSKTTTKLNEGSAFESDDVVLNLLVSQGFLPNKNYTGELPYEALKDKNGNVIAGAYVFKFKTKSIIAEAGSLLNLVATVNNEGTEVAVSWTNPQGVDLVNIVAKRNTVGYVTDMNNGTTVYNALGTSFVDANVELDTEYYYTLFAVDSIGEYNNTSRVKVLVEKAPAIVIVTPEASISEINSIITDLPDNSEILFAEGDYDLDNKIIIDRSNITLRGTSSTFLNKTKDITTETEGLIEVLGTSDNYLSNIRLINLNLNGNYSTNAEAGTNNFDGHGINIQHVGKTTSSSSSGYNSTIVGVSSDVTRGVLIKNCIVENFKDYGINLNISNNNTVIGNTVIGNTVQNNSNIGIHLNTSSNNTITGNTVQNNGAVGIYLVRSNNNTITGNTAQNNTSYGIGLYSLSSSNTITGNIIQNNGSNGINLNYSSNNTITSNTVQNNNNIAIYLLSSNNNTITSNTAQNNKTYGINLYSSNNNTVTGNTLSNKHTATDILLNAQCDGNVICANQTNLAITNGGTNTILQHNVQY